LENGTYEILKFSWVKNKQYKSDNPDSMRRVILVEIEDQVLFLPEYFAVSFKNQEEKLSELNTDGVKKYLIFSGMRENG